MLLSGLLVLLVGFVAGTRSNEIYAAVAPIVGIRASSDTLNLSDVQETYQTLKANYNGELSDDELIEGASRGLVEAAGDPYTIYLSADEAEKFRKDLNGDIGGGIGAEIGLRNKQPTVIRALPNNPAIEAGLHANDRILAVNDEISTEWTVEKTVTKIKGKPGTTVKLTVQRGNQTKNFNIERAVINNPSVSSKQQGRVGIVTISRFDDNTVSLARKAVDKLKASGANKFVLDLRGNGGGTLDSTPGVAGIWLDDKPVVSVRSTQGSNRNMQSEGTAVLVGVPLAVLINGGTASAAEIVAGALHDGKAATLVGEKTFGKGTVQEIIPLDDGAELKVTVQRWFTPNGKNISKNGIKPDVTVKLTQKDLDAGRDPQLERAIKELNK